MKCKSAARFLAGLVPFFMIVCVHVKSAHHNFRHIYKMFKRISLNRGGEYSAHELLSLVRIKVSYKVGSTTSLRVIYIVKDPDRIIRT
jgi:hypothetical protein